MGILDKGAAAAYLATSTRRVDELRRAGRLLAVLDGREFKFKVADLDDYIESLPLSVEV
jgi:excisionase family DNA binding protein